MTNPILEYSEDMSPTNKLLSEAAVRALIDSSLGDVLPFYDDDENYDAGDIVYSAGHFYKAAVNINAEGGLPATNGNWEKKARLDYTTTATAGSTTTLTNLSTEIQFFTGTLAQNVDMPVVAGLTLGRQWFIYNKSSGILTIRSSGSNTITTVPAGAYAILTNILITGTSAASWSYDVFGVLPSSGVSLALSSFLNEAKWTDIASATTTDLGAANGNYGDVTGTTTITGLGTIQAGTRRIVRFTGALTLTHNATSLILPGGVNITTVAGDVACFVSLGSGNWRCVYYTPITVTGTGASVKATSPTLVTPVLGVATATSINKVAITAPATSATLAISNGKTLTVKKSLSLEGTDSTEHTFPLTNSSLARTDAAQNFTGTQTFENYLQLSENGGILLDQTLSADGKFSIAKGRIGTLGETLVYGDLVYYKQSDQRFWKYDTDTESTSVNVLVAFVCVGGNAGDDVQLMLEGIIRADSKFPSISIGAPFYGSSTSGNISSTKPTTGFVRVLGYGDTADSVIFKPSDEYYELGVFSPIITFGGGATGLTYNSQNGHFSKSMGRLFARLFVQAANKGSSTGAMVIGSMPYASRNATLNHENASLYVDNANAIGVPSGLNIAGNATVELYQMSTAGTISAITDATATNTIAVRASISYLI